VGARHHHHGAINSVSRLRLRRLITPRERDASRERFPDNSLTVTDGHSVVITCRPEGSAAATAHKRATATSERATATNECGAATDKRAAATTSRLLPAQR
jgi:hypothetical protein